MIPKALSPKEYKEKAYQFIRGNIDQKALLKQWELEYLEVNENFHFYLADAIEHYIYQEHKVVTEILIANPKMNFKDLKEGLNRNSIDRYKTYKNFIYQRGLSLAYQKELEFDLVGIVKPIVQNYIKYYPTTGSGFNWIEELKHYIVKCKLQFERLKRLKSELPEPTFKAKIKLEIIDLERAIEEREEIYYKSMKPKSYSLIGLHEANQEKHPEKEQMLWYKFTNGILIDFTKRMFPEVTTPLGNSPKKIKEQIPTTNKTNKKKRDFTFNELFLSNEERLNAFLSLLKREEIKALDSNNNWIYGKKNTIVACFEALENKEFIRKNISKAQLQRIVSRLIKFEGSNQLFRKGYNPIDYDYFLNLFNNHLR